VPVTYFFPPQWPQYTGNVVWTTGGVPHNGLFQEDMTYTATVTLTAASGFTITGVGADAFSHEGKDAKVERNPANEANPERVTVVFPALGGGETETETEIGATAGW
jgi:hypothetical protein